MRKRKCGTWTTLGELLDQPDHPEAQASIHIDSQGTLTQQDRDEIAKFTEWLTRRYQPADLTGQTLVKLAEYAGLSMGQLSQVARVAKGALADFTEQRRNPSRECAERLAKALGVKLEPSREISPRQAGEGAPDGR